MIRYVRYSRSFFNVPETDLVRARENFTAREENNEYTEYLKTELELSDPIIWADALEMYEQFMAIRWSFINFFVFLARNIEKQKWVLF